MYDNEATFGGGVYIFSPSDTLIENTEIYRNRAYLYGGGVYGWARAGAGRFTVRGGHISRNRAEGDAGAKGGGVYVASGGARLLCVCGESNHRPAPTHSHAPTRRPTFADV